MERSCWSFRIVEVTSMTKRPLGACLPRPHIVRDPWATRRMGRLNVFPFHLKPTPSTQPLTIPKVAWKFFGWKNQKNSLSLFGFPLSSLSRNSGPMGHPERSGSCFCPMRVLLRQFALNLQHLRLRVVSSSSKPHMTLLSVHWGGSR